MRKAFITMLVTVLALALMSGAAAARSGISVSPVETTVTIPSLTIELGLGTPVTCSVTLGKTSHGRIAKTAGALVATTSIAIGTGRCVNGDMGLLVGGSRVTGAQGPYHLTYQAFSGTLPNINAIARRLNDFTFWISIPSFGIQCLSSGAVDLNITTTGGNPITGVSISPQSVPLAASLPCPVLTVQLSGTGTLSPSTRMTLF